jgi:hypothetical protein
MRTQLAGAIISAVALAQAGTACGGAAATTPAPAAASKPNPVKACLQLQAWQLTNNGHGISKALRQRLLGEAHGTALGTDIAQWENDLTATAHAAQTGNYGALGPVGLTSQLLSDGQQVAADCDGYGVRHTLGGS